MVSGASVVDAPHRTPRVGLMSAVDVRGPIGRKDATYCCVLSKQANDLMQINQHSA